MDKDAKTLDLLVAKAKTAVEKRVPDGKDRPWLTGTPLYNYQDNYHAVVFHVLEGTPSRGFVLGTIYPLQAIAYDSRGRIIKRFNPESLR